MIDLDEKVKKLKSALPKLDVQLVVLDAKVDKAAAAAEKSIASRLAIFESRLEAALDASDKKATKSLSVLESRLDAIRTSLQADWDEERKQISVKLAETEASRVDLHTKLTEMGSVVGHLKENLITNGAQAVTSLNNGSRLIAGEESMTSLQDQLDKLKADSLSHAELMQSKMEAMMTRILAFEASQPRPDAMNPSLDDYAPLGKLKEAHEQLADNVKQLTAKVEDCQAKMLMSPQSPQERNDSGGGPDFHFPALSDRLERAEQSGNNLQVQILELTSKVENIAASTLPANTQAFVSDNANTAEIQEVNIVIQDIQHRLGTLESSAHTLLGASATSSIHDEAFQQLDRRVKMLEDKTDVSQTNISSETFDLSVLRNQLMALSEKVNALDPRQSVPISALSPPSDVLVTLGASPSTDQSSAASIPPSTNTSDLSVRFDELTDELHGRVSDLQDKMGHLLQLLVQRVKAIEVASSIKAQAESLNGQELSTESHNTPSNQIFSEDAKLQQHFDLLQERLAAAEGTLAALASTPEANTKPWEVDVLQLSTQIQQLQERITTSDERLDKHLLQLSDPSSDSKPWGVDLMQLSIQILALQERLSATNDRFETHSAQPNDAMPLPRSQDWEVELIQLSTQMQDLKSRVKEISSIPAGVQQDVLDQRINEVQESNVTRLQEMHDMITPVLQLLVQRVKALETSGPVATSSSSPSTEQSVSSEVRQKVMEVSDAVSGLSGRIDEVDEELSEKLETMQSKVSSVMQLLVQRVKALEASLGG